MVRYNMKYCLALFAFFFSAFSYSAPDSELWPYWDKHNPQSEKTLSHQKWQQFLDNNLIQQGENILVAYAKVSPSDKQLLIRYLEELTSLDPRDLNRNEQYAYWVNLYNALTVKLILDNYPVKSITKLGGFFSFGPWGDEVTEINDKALTLNDIEHRILRPIWQDPRTHYAVNCASLGCPNLQPVAFNSNNFEMLLDQAAGSFINSDKGVKVENGTGKLSSIYKWFAIDFGDNQALLKHLKKYRPSLDINIEQAEFDYNWSLNEAK